MLLYEKHKKVANFNVTNAPKLSAVEVHTDIIHLNFSADEKGKGLLLILDLEWMQGNNNQNKNKSKTEKFFKYSKNIRHKDETTQLSIASIYKLSSVRWHHCLLIWAPFVA
jgi:hypothetical protein